MSAGMVIAHDKRMLALKRIFITGAAGLIGAEVTARLCQQGHSVTGLVHHKAQIQANDGTDIPARPWSAAAHRPGMVQMLAGDVAKRHFGWIEAQWGAVAADHDLIIHSAALLRFDLPYEESAAVNVEGTRHALALAELGAMAFLHISTAYVCGIAEGRIEEAAIPSDRQFSNSYEASKAEAEHVVRDSGQPFAIARPSIVVGDSRTGMIRQFDAIYSAFKIIAEGRISALPANQMAMLDFVPIDHVAGGIAAIADAMDQALGKTFHLSAQQPIRLIDFFRVLGDFPQFKLPIVIDAASFEPLMLEPLQRRMLNRLLGPYLVYFQRSPRFQTAALEELTGLTCPPTDSAFLKRLILYCITAGLLGPAVMNERLSADLISR